MLGDIAIFAIGMVVGVFFSETIRAFIRKRTNGAFFGTATPAPEPKQ